MEFNLGQARAHGNIALVMRFNSIEGLPHLYLQVLETSVLRHWSSMKALIVMTASNCINTDKQFHKKSIICCKNLLLVLFPKTEKEITLEKKKRRKRQTKVKVHNPREEKNNHPDTIPHSHMNTPSLLQSCKYLHESLTVLNKLWCYLSLFIMDYQLALGSTTSLSYGYYSLFYYFIYFIIY